MKQQDSRGWNSRTHRRFVWSRMFKLEHCRGPADLRSGATTACPDGTGLRRGDHGLLSCRWRDRCAGCLRPAAASELMPKVLRKLLRLADCGAQDHQPKSLGPHCCGSAMRTATQHKGRTSPLSCHVTENRVRERRNVRADCAVCQGQTRQSFVMKPGLNFRLFRELIHEHLTTRCPFRRRPECSSVGRLGLLVARSQPRGSVYRPGNMDCLAHAAAGSGAGYCASVSRRMRLGNRAGGDFHASRTLDRIKVLGIDARAVFLPVESFWPCAGLSTTRPLVNPYRALN
jgi:hypothetical protein